MIEVKLNGNKYENYYAIQNTIDFYAYKAKPGTDWQYWAAFGVDNTDIDAAKRQMMDTKMSYQQTSKIKMHQIHIKIPYEDINRMIIKPLMKAEQSLVGAIGQYFYSYGFQNISFIYRNKPGIFIRVIVNSTCLSSGKEVGNFKPFMKELNDYLNNYIETY